MSQFFKQFSGTHVQATNVTTGLGGTFVAFDFSSPTTVWDTLGAFNGANPTRLTAPWKGYYHIFGRCQWITDVTGNKAICIKVNGTTFQAIRGMYTNEPGYGFMFQSVADTLKLNAGDYVELIGQGPNNTAAGTGLAMIYSHHPFIGARNPVKNIAACANNSVDQTIGTSGGWLPVSFDTTLLDTTGTMKTSTGTAFTIPYTGYWLLEGGGFFAFEHPSSQSEGGRGFGFAINQSYTTTYWPQFSASQTGNGGGEGCSVGGVQKLNAGDLVELVVQTQLSINTTLFGRASQGVESPWMAIRMVGV